MQVDSFVHLHLGIDAMGLPPDLDCHHLVVNEWSDVTLPQNVCIISIPTGEQNPFLMTCRFCRFCTYSQYLQVSTIT
jgi:hypothetical protein